MKLLVTGAAGMLGTDLCDELTRRGHIVIPAGRETRPGFVTLDISDTAATLAAVREIAPDAIAHCAAWTDVDGAERDPESAYRVNALGSWNLAHAAHDTGAWLLGVSTDFVFDGTKQTPYHEFDPVHPLGAYGASKQAGERLIRETLPARSMIVRTSWLFGKHGKSFPQTIARLAAKLPEVPVVSDQIGTPTHTLDLAHVIADLLESPLPGTYHASGAGQCSWHEFAQAIVEAHGLSTPVVPITAREYADRFGSPTVRPAYSVLDNLALRLRGMDTLPHWRDALKAFLAR
ncbi:MAG: dTDP-4-dehydrorhamnose reductase [Armatimonadetes bacterium]|nr:dTDP-4-dehydrorhamnose reductase [Armatimonadota bacterium]